MGCVTATAKRRRRQAKQNFNHLHTSQRPNYKKTDAGTSARRLYETVRRENERKQRKGSKK